MCDPRGDNCLKSAGQRSSAHGFGNMQVTENSSPPSAERSLNIKLIYVWFRFGWTDENLAVIPRNKALVSCGQNKTGLVTWRAAVKQKFDVFCFNETGRRQ